MLHALLDRVSGDLTNPLSAEPARAADLADVDDLLDRGAQRSPRSPY